MSDDPLARNRLATAGSPYLRQHADNPVNWQPWDETALTAAAERDRPIFLSIGYAACHWCHVMESESFEDDDVAAILNENYVPIKVDREQRPDVDAVYMSICTQVTGQGGWPLSAWLTPDGRPFYVGTYFPRTAERGMPAFPDLLEDIADTWSDPADRAELESRADEWAAAVESDVGVQSDAADARTSGTGASKSTAGDSDATGSGADTADPASADGTGPATAPGSAPGDGHLDDPAAARAPAEAAPVDPDLLTDAADTAVRAADREHGGWATTPGGPKFPQPRRIELVLRAAADGGNDSAATTATNALDAMGAGGLFDHVGGGFHRYCTDPDWTVPHFEKMLYDNAELARVALLGHQVAGESRYADLARRTFNFVDRELTHSEGGFYSTLSAQSRPPAHPGEDGGPVDASGDDQATVEGAYYVWTPDQVRAAVEDDRDAAIFCDRHGVTERGNFEGATVLTIAESVAALADAHDATPEAVTEALERAHEQVREARAGRPRPARDEKILAGWNGLMIRSLATGALVLDDEVYADRAVEALGFVRDQLWDADDGRLSRRYEAGDVGHEGYLDDYAHLGRGALATYEATGDPEPLEFALALGEAVSERFYADGTLYLAPEDAEDLLARPQELTDQSTPASAAEAVALAVALDHFVDHDRFRTMAADVLGTHADRVAARPMEHASFVLAGDVAVAGHTELTLACEERPSAWTATLADTVVPRRLVAQRPPTEEGLAAWIADGAFDETPPIWAGREAVDGEPTVYACRNFACSPPRHDLAAAIEWAGDRGPGSDAGDSPGE